MTARGRFVARLVTILIALAGLVTVGALPAAAQPNSGPVPYVALGDSYAAGQGGGDYLNTCLESPNGYPYLLDARSRIDLRDNVACTGAKASDLVTSSTQLSALNVDTELVTITVGAADLNLSEVLAACTAVPPTPVQCQAAIANAQALLGALAVSLTNLYALVADAAPNALIVVTGYPYLFEPPAEGDPNAAIITAIRNAITALNTTIQQTVAAAQTAGLNIIYVDVTEEFAGHGIGSKQPFINAAGPDAYHPNAAGYRAYAKAIFAAIRSVWKEEKKQAA
ncbi:MAG TPA: SGNH/GDSL hydrolase family protein [Propionibacteriaceae bacterium]|jgi:lysophospholipase L1-like esterase|nr:SGNH/GDSL hydrolase family protein [Propionibacteriaceae bacterium]